MRQITLPALLRARAWEALKATWPTMLALSCAINLVSTLLNQLILKLPGPVSMILSIVITAAMMVPMLGVSKGMLEYFRRKPLSFDCVKSMLPHAWKVICFYFWEMLCLVGWMLPGAAVMTVGGMLIALGTDGTAIIACGGLLAVAGMVLMLVLAIRAALNYSMANCILIDDPSISVRETLRKSKAMIRGYRWHYVKVGLPVFIILFIAIIIIGAATAVLPGWLGTVLTTAASAVSGMMSYYFLPVMYEELCRIGR